MNYFNTPITHWARCNIPDDALFYKEGMHNQVDNFVKIAKELYLEEPQVVSTHISKSVKLPVAKFSIPGGIIFVRDNFHDIKLSVMMDDSIELNYEDFYGSLTQEQYDKAKQSSLGFGEKDDLERMRIKYEANKADYDSDDWYHKHWSSSSIIREGDKIYCTGAIHKVYCEGIDSIGLPSEVFKPYRKTGYNSKNFTLETGGEDGLKTTLARLVQAAAKCFEPDRILSSLYINAERILIELENKTEIIKTYHNSLKKIWKNANPNHSRFKLQTQVEDIVNSYRIELYNRIDGKAAMDLVLERDDYGYQPNTPLYFQSISFDKFLNELQRFTEIARREII